MMERRNRGKKGKKGSVQAESHSSRIPTFHSPAPPPSGFTLIELLVALALLAILGASLAGVLRTSSDSIDQANASLENLTRLRSLDLLLGGALNDAVDITLTSAEQKMLSEDGSYDSDLGTVRFRGEPLSLGFCLERPFLSAERDGYMHWIMLDAIEDEETGLLSLWLKDISFIPEIDNPVGDDWGALGSQADEWLPVEKVRLLHEVELMGFTYWLFPEEDSFDELEEMEADELSGDYALAFPDRIELELKMPKTPVEVLQFNYNLREDIL
jgi:prepilin-type N-terminal cleavage/methylation domain-containing protein